jgi:hypothetical protein
VNRTDNALASDRRLALALAQRAYASGEVRLVTRDLNDCDYIIATRQGLLAAGAGGWKRIAHGQFFGLTMDGSDVLAFEACDRPRSPSRMGRIVRLRVKESRIVDTEVLVTGLDNGCHQIDLIGDTLVVVDTYRQRILEIAPDATVKEFQPLAFDREQPGMADYVHFNSVLACGDRRLLLLHNDVGRTGRASEIALLDASWTMIDRRPMAGTGCHNLALLEDGAILSCGSLQGTLISTTGTQARVSSLMTRGLAVGQDVIAVGGSTFSEREHRDGEPGVLHLLDRQFRLLSSLPLPAPPTEIRRIDGNDLSLSRHVAARGLTLGWP